MANYMLMSNWQVMGFISMDETPIGFDNGESSLCLNIGDLTQEEAIAQWKTLFQQQYPNKQKTYINDMREQEYQRRGVGKEAMALAMWEAQYEGKVEEASAMQQKREEIMAMYPMPQTLTEIKASATIEINRLVGDARIKYITNIPGQEITYQQKAVEVARYDTDPNPDPVNYPYLNAEATATGQTIVQIYQLVKATATAWSQLGAAIEGVRRGGVVGVENATDEAGVKAAFDAFKAQLAQF